MPTGTVKWFDKEKGYGFLIPSDGSADIFVHLQQVTASKMETLEPGATLSYEISKRGSKIAAEQLALIAPPAPPAPKVDVINRPRKAPVRELDAEEEFEREWGLKRAY